MARHRSPRGSTTTSSGLIELPKSISSTRHRHGSARGWARRPLTAAAATLVAAGIFVGSQPVSTEASAEARRADVATTAPIADRAVAAQSGASRDEREAVESVAAAPTIPGADQALVPDLSESGSAGGANGSAALTGEPCPTEGFGGVKPHVAQAGYHLIAVFGLSESDVGGVASRPGNPSSDHPRGLALDFMVDNSTGDALAAYADEHSAELGINYILWEVPDHYDHVHISFNSTPGTGMSC